MKSHLYKILLGMMMGFPSVQAQQQGCSLVYTLSPYMPMSMQGLLEIQKFSENYQWNLKVILDPNAVMTASHTNFYQMSDSEMTIFLQQGFFNHFPAYFLQKANGEFVPLRFGYVFASQLKSLIEFFPDSKECWSGVPHARSHH